MAGLTSSSHWHSRQALCARRRSNAWSMGHCPGYLQQQHEQQHGQRQQQCLQGVSRVSAHKRPAAASCTDLPLLLERGVAFTPGSAFYRPESAQGRDLAVLAAAVYKAEKGSLRVLDVMSGSGMRGARYLQQAQADMVWCNDHNPSVHNALVYNLVSSLPHSARYMQDTKASRPLLFATSHSGAPSDTHDPQQPTPAPPPPASSALGKSRAWDAQAVRWRPPGIRSEAWEWPADAAGPGPRCRVSHVEANRLLTSCYLAEDYYDLVDVDSFGSDTTHLPAAIDAVKHGGMLYLTGTDGMSAGGKRPERALAAYGAYARALPFCNEQGLRLLIGSAVKEAAARGIVLEPLFSLYAPHGPVFRVMLSAKRSHAWPAHHYGFIGHCFIHGESRTVGWRSLSQAWCRCCKPPPESDSDGQQQQQQQQQQQPTPLVLSGPMWTGPLHSRPFIDAMMQQAQLWGWIGYGLDPAAQLASRSKNNGQRPLEAQLQLMWEEADEKLPPWFVPIDSLAQHLTSCPSRDVLIKGLLARGFVACKCHIENKALRTNATVRQIIDVAVECGYTHRQGGQALVHQVFKDKHAVTEDISL